MTRRAADLLVDCLAAHEVDRIFCVPGESYLAVLDALHDRNTIETIIAGTRVAPVSWPWRMRR
ncbi:MAG: hypothetical protein HC868_03155 [Sphingomonadales bacterium]|nr:hypothetical protein [Sphingomonadales bacterium]